MGVISNICYSKVMVTRFLEIQFFLLKTNILFFILMFVYSEDKHLSE
jgi:hypothetical protein